MKRLGLLVVAAFTLAISSVITVVPVEQTTEAYVGPACGTAAITVWEGTYKGGDHWHLCYSSAGDADLGNNSTGLTNGNCDAGTWAGWSNCISSLSITVSATSGGPWGVVLYDYINFRGYLGTLCNYTSGSTRTLNSSAAINNKVESIYFSGATC